LDYLIKHSLSEYENDVFSIVFVFDFWKSVLCVVAYVAGVAATGGVAMDCRRGDGGMFPEYVPYLRRDAGQITAMVVIISVSDRYVESDCPTLSVSGFPLHRCAVLGEGVAV